MQTRAEKGAAGTHDLGQTQAHEKVPITEPLEFKDIDRSTKTEVPISS